MIGRRPGGGINLLMLAYVAVFALIAGVVALTLIGRDRPSSSVELDRPQAKGKASPQQPSPASAPAAAPTATPAAVQIQPLPVPAPPPPSPTSDVATAPPIAPPVSAPPVSAMPPVTANGFPSPPPEKPQPPSKQPPADQTLTTPATASAPVAPAASPVPAPQVATAPPPPPSTVTPSTPAAAIPSNPSALALVETSPYGPLPRIAADGRLPWIVNDTRFDHRTRMPRVTILLIGLGLDAKTTEDAIVKLPPEIGLAFLPYTPNLDRWTKLARDFGHEVLLSLPLEGGDPATQQALGPRMLAAGAPAAENLDRLRWVLSRATGYIGLVTWEGETFLADEKATAPILQEISGRGLMLVDSRMAKPNTVQQLGGAVGLPFAKSRGFIDEPRDAATIDANLARLEELAKTNNFAMAMAVAFPTSIERLVNWSRTVPQRGFVLAPVTGVTQCTGLCQTRVQRHAAAVASAQGK